MPDLSGKYGSVRDWFSGLSPMARFTLLFLVPGGLFLTLGLAVQGGEADAPPLTPVQKVAQQRDEIDKDLFLCVLGDDAPGFRDSFLIFATMDSEDQTGKEVHDVLVGSYASLYARYSMDPVLYEACVSDVARYDPEYR